MNVLSFKTFDSIVPHKFVLHAPLSTQEQDEARAVGSGLTLLCRLSLAELRPPLSQEGPVRTRVNACPSPRGPDDDRLLDIF